jgi:hypothetical protein
MESMMDLVVYSFGQSLHKWPLNERLFISCLHGYIWHSFVISIGFDSDEPSPFLVGKWYMNCI